MRLILLSIFFGIFQVHAQTGTLKGRAFNGLNNEAVPFANIVLVDQQIGGVSDIDGLFRIEEIPPGVYDVSCSFIGFESVYLQGIRINTS
ncbi:MAG: hypothetical protein ACI8ZO_000756, partial [Flavobacteriales bacterium]